jgi:serine/threonine protein kinase
MKSREERREAEDPESSLRTVGASESPTGPAPAAGEPCRFRQSFLPRYEVLDQLGTGGMGAVYRARDTLLGREVAIKVVHPEKMSPELHSRFEVEARAVAQLDHPHIVKIFDVGKCQPEGGGAEAPYLALEFVPGGSLSRKLGKKPLAPVEAARLVRLLARAMQHAHERGIAHRDLKPDNVLLAAPVGEPALDCSLGFPKVTDFGLARKVEGERRLTQMGALMGTPEYMAPEQAEGLTNTGPPSDVWALGVILYRLLAGRLPFKSSTTMDLLFKICREPPPALPSLSRKVPPELERICLQCLRKSPANRPTAGKLAEMLESFIDHATHKEKTAESGIPVVLLVGTILALPLLIGAVVGGLMWIASKTTVPDPSPPAQPPAIVNKIASGPSGPPFEGKDGDAHEVPNTPFPPAGFPPAHRAPSVHAFIPVQNPVLDGSQDEKDVPARKGGKLGRETLAAVRSGTVNIFVTRKNGLTSGSGFFAAPEAPNLVVTSADLVGMFRSQDSPPTKIEVVVHSGQKDKKEYVGKLAGFDRSSDLAVIDIGVKEGLPRPLKVRSAAKVSQQDEVYVFGFPREAEFALRDTSVSQLCRRNGFLHHLHVNHVLQSGNSGSPVVDTSGQVVAVVGEVERSEAATWAVCGERVHGLLYGRISEMGIGQAVKTGEKVAAPVKIQTLDPRGRIKQMAVEVWAGNPPTDRARSRPAATSPPTTQPGDSPRKRFSLSRTPGKERIQSEVEHSGELELPALPAGKVYWVQPTWVREDGKTLWGSASVYQGSEPVEAKPVDLHLRYQAGETHRRLLLSVVNRLNIVENDDEYMVAKTTAGFSERVVSASPSGATLALFYQGAAQSRVVDKQPQDDPTLEEVRARLGVMKARVQVDGAGQVTMNQFVLARDREGHTALNHFHDALKAAMDPVFVPLPNRTLKPGDTWERKGAPCLIQLPMLSRIVPLDLTCTYLGTRHGQAGREEAVVALHGRPSDGETTAKVYGQMGVDVASGMIGFVELNLQMELPGTTVAMVAGEAKEVRFRLSLAIRLRRELRNL